jgi:hypothetical protein
VLPAVSRVEIAAALRAARPDHTLAGGEPLTKDHGHR